MNETVRMKRILEIVECPLPTHPTRNVHGVYNKNALEYATAVLCIRKLRTIIIIAIIIIIGVVKGTWFPQWCHYGEQIRYEIHTHTHPHIVTSTIRNRKFNNLIAYISVILMSMSSHSHRLSVATSKC